MDRVAITPVRALVCAGAYWPFYPEVSDNVMALYLQSWMLDYKKIINTVCLYRVPFTFKHLHGGTLGEVSLKCAQVKFQICSIFNSYNLGIICYC